MPGRRRHDLDVGRLTKILEADQACADLRLYFGAGLGRGELPPFTGGLFEFLDGGGNRADACNRFTASDILSIEMSERLGVNTGSGAGQAAVGVGSR